MSAPDAAAGLARVAAWIDEALSLETIDRQWIAENAAAMIRDLTKDLACAPEPGRQAQAPPGAGPFDAERQAAELPAVRAVYEAMGRSPGPMTPWRRAEIEGMKARLITEACERAGVELGAYDRRIVAWLGTWEAQTCAVIAGLITRAHAAGIDVDR